MSTSWELVAALVAFGSCSVTAHRATEGRLGWLLLGLSSLAWAVGEAFWCYYDLVDHIQDPFPSMADVGFLAAVPLMIAGLLLFPHSPSRTAAHVQGLLDGIIIAVSILFASWVTVLGPLYRAHQGGAFKQALSLAYPMSDVIMVSLVVILIARTGQRRRAGLSLVMIGVVAFAASDSSFSYLTEVNNYGIGNWLDTGWVAGYLLIGLGASWTRWAPAAPETADIEESVTSLIAPYAPALVVLVVVAVSQLLGHRIEPVAWLMVLALTLLILGREVLRLLNRAAIERLFPQESESGEGTGLSRGPDSEDVLVGR